MSLKTDNWLIGCKLSKDNDTYVLTFPKVKRINTETKIYFKEWTKLVERMNELVGEK